MKSIKSQKGSLSIPKIRIIARLLGDGSIYRSGTNYTIKYEVKDEESLEAFSRDIKCVYGLETNFGFNRSGVTGEPIPFVRLRSKKVYSDLMKYGPYTSRHGCVPEEIMNSTSEMKKEFLKVLFSDDGTVLPKKEIKLYSINRKALCQVRNLLKSFNIDSRIHGGYGYGRNVYGLVISGIGDITRFAEKIGFSLTRKMDNLREILQSRK